MKMARLRKSFKFSVGTALVLLLLSLTIFALLAINVEKSITAKYKNSTVNRVR
ncbi:MAG: hypothetical protein PVH45_01415 [Candidatus Omnitrophota bacterium]|jgi:hypothetical protein